MTSAAPSRASSASVLDSVVRIHAEESAMLRHQRTALVRAPHIGLLMLGRHDQRIAAHQDGLAVAGPAGMAQATAVLEEGIPGAAAGESFALGVALITAGDTQGLDALAARCTGRADLLRGLASALGWVSAEQLRGIVKDWLGSNEATKRICALAACAMHRVDAGPALAPALAHAQASVRVAALRAAGRTGRLDLLAAASAAMSDDDPAVAFWAAWAACRLGERNASLKKLAQAVMTASELAEAALPMLMCALPEPQAQEFARHVSAMAKSDGTPANQRRLVRTLGLLGDSRFVPWLIDRMDDAVLARTAGEAFSAITGADLASLQLERLEGPPARREKEEAASVSAASGVPPDTSTGANEDDEPIALDPDRDLPWPDRALVMQWWQRHPVSSSPQRCFAGHPSGEAAWQRVLREGNQRQRTLAALHLGVQAPASRMFPVAAPAWRQQRWLP